MDEQKEGEKHKTDKVALTDTDLPAVGNIAGKPIEEETVNDDLQTQLSI